MFHFHLRFQTKQTMKYILLILNFVFIQCEITYIEVKYPLKVS